MEVTHRGSIFTFDLTDDEAGALFRIGLQKFVDGLGLKYKVLPATKQSVKGISRKYDMGDELYEGFIKDAIQKCIREAVMTRPVAKKKTVR